MLAMAMAAMKRDDGFVEEHCNECLIKEAVVFSVCLVGWY